ncbi:6-hydroxymethylpterin diphosphokinase MptE-like protein [Aquirufa sp. KTFRIE-69F]|uniref:6-hydroxymethylpterin diphosphokinase MptE-like protein n=1 Tax=Aquirufa originis TaxID=3096514 RepID=A0ABW6D868_9BACT
MQVLLNDLSFWSFLRFYILSKVLRFAEFFYFVIPNYFEIKKIKSFKNLKVGKSAFVFAGGPSISQLDINKIKIYKDKGFDVFAGNSFINSNLGQVIKPDYYFISDDKFFHKHNSSFVYDENLKVVRNIEEMGIPCFYPHRYSKYVSRHNNSFIFNDTIDLFSSNVADLTKPRPYVSMTLYKALSLACYMGYSKIYICGFDNDYFKNYQCNHKNEIYFEDKHFYTNEIGENTIRKVDKNFHKSMSSLLIHISTLFSGLEKFEKYPIINLDCQGLVDAFSKDHNLDIYK